MKIIAKGLSYLNLFFLMVVVAAVDSEGIPTSVLMGCLLLSIVLGVLLAYFISFLDSQEKKKKKRRKRNANCINKNRRRRVS